MLRRLLPEINYAERSWGARPIVLIIEGSGCHRLLLMKTSPRMSNRKGEEQR